MIQCRPPETYDYPARARRDLWAALASVPDEVMSRSLLGGSEFHCIKDLVFHVAAVQDGWVHEVIRVVAPHDAGDDRFKVEGSPLHKEL